MIATNTNPAELARELADVEAQIAETRPIDALLQQRESLRAQIDTLDLKITNLDYCSGAGPTQSLGAIQGEIDRIHEIRARVPADIERIRFGKARLEAALNGQLGLLAGMDEQVEALRDFDEHVGERLKFFEGLSKDLAKKKAELVKQRNAAADELVRIEATFMKAGKDADESWS